MPKPSRSFPQFTFANLFPIHPHVFFIVQIAVIVADFDPPLRPGHLVQASLLRRRSNIHSFRPRQLVFLASADGR